MKAKHFFIRFALSLSLFLSGSLISGVLNTAHATAPSLNWNTFLGSAGADHGDAIAADNHGNVYVTGYSTASWGIPKNAHTGNNDAFIAKFNQRGELQWNTFLGSADSDGGSGITVDGGGNVYVAGYSYATWGMPKNAYAGRNDAFIAKLNSNGELQWNTFFGSSSADYASAITVDNSDNIYVLGYSYLTWGSPEHPHSGMADAFVARLSGTGILQWHTFMGSSPGTDHGNAIAADKNGNIYVAGDSPATWGTPKTSHAGDSDSFVTKFDSSGVRQWNTFMGASGTDYGWAITVDGSNNIYVAGDSRSTWGTPVNPHAGVNGDAFVTSLNSSGIRQWNTFMGSSDYDRALGITVDSSRNIYVSGESGATWGSPLHPFPGDEDAFVAGLKSNGELEWNTFLGASTDEDDGKSIAADGNGNIYVTGSSYDPWGFPKNLHAGGTDAFIARFLADICNYFIIKPGKEKSVAVCL